MRGVTREPVSVLAIGADYRTAGAAIRERLAAAARAFHPWLAGRGARAIAGGFVLSTCHRVEFYLAVRDPFAAEREMRAFAADTTGTDALGPSAPVRRAMGANAVRHLCRVASGLDSMVLGEHAISGQVRRAIAEARAAGTFVESLTPVAAAALASSGRVRSETTLADGSASIAGVAVQSLVEEGALENARVLIVGAGPVGREAAARLARRRPASIAIASRSITHARQVAARIEADAVALDEVPRRLAIASVCVAAIRTPGWRLSAAAVAASRTTDAVPLVLVDLSQPRAFDPAVAALAGVRLVTVDDLGPAASAVLARRRAAVPAAEAIVADESRRAMAKLAAHDTRWVYEAVS